MLTFETILVLLLGATVLAGFARRLSVPYPSLLALGGVLIALLPGGPRLELPPDLILALFVAPVQLDAAYDTSLSDLRKNWLAILGLVLFAVRSFDPGGSFCRPSVSSRSVMGGGRRARRAAGAPGRGGRSGGLAAGQSALPHPHGAGRRKVC